MKPVEKPQQVTKPKRRKFAINILPERCKGCGICMEFCVKKALTTSPDFNRKGYHPPRLKEDAECGGCDLCRLICPDFAIFVTEIMEDNPK
jgi:2-oxoglutarate ferredoxin oxidoreductase subunit delta